MRKNGSLREWIAITVLLLLVLGVVAQTTAKPRPHARIAGTVLDGRGHELNRISVHVVSEKTGIYMPTVVSNETGHFVVENLEPGTYNIFGESDAAAYPNTALPFYRSANPLKVAVGNDGDANVVLVLDPKAGILSGIVRDEMTGQPIASRRAPHFIIRKVANPADSIEFLGPATFRWLIPPATEVTLEVFAEDYKPWVYTETPGTLTPTPFRIESGEDKILDIRLERQAPQKNHPE